MVFGQLASHARTSFQGLASEIPRCLAGDGIPTYHEDLLGITGNFHTCAMAVSHWPRALDVAAASDPLRMRMRTCIWKRLAVTQAVLAGYH
jgi:hypothetical protein